VIRTSTRLLLLVLVFAATPLFAQSDDDHALKPAEPDFTLISLPTSLRLPVWGSEFRVTHRFVRPLKCDSCQDNLLEDFFGVDNGAVIGLEYRIGLIPNGQVVIHRARDRKTIQLTGEYGLTRQGSGMPLEIAGLVAVEGTDNFRDDYSPTVGAIFTRLFGEAGAIHIEPIWVGNSNLDEPTISDDSTFMLGLGARGRIRPTVYITLEYTPRLSGYKPGVDMVAFAIEKRAGGHMFQLNFSNSLATTNGAIARGGFNNDNWYMGFNITRKFF